MAVQKLMKLTPHNVSEDASMLVETLLGAEPESFDPEAEITRLTTYTCPECGSINTTQPDDESMVDCMDCGIFFKWPQESSGVQAMRYRESLDGTPPADPHTPEQFQAYIDKYGAGPPRKPIKHIETTSDFREYELRVRDFFRAEGINNLSQVNDDDEGEFSWSRCDCCHRNLGGTRYTCSGYNPTTREVAGPYSICSDCFYYAEYGTLDDQTMLDLKDDLKPEPPTQ